VIRALLLAALLAGGAALAQAPADLAKRAAYGEAGARAQLERLAESGDARAEHYMGQLHLAGRGVKKDEALAVEWFRRAAARGDLASAHNLGVIHERASGTLHDRDEALKWYRFAAERGFARSQANLGQLLSGKDDAEARQWIEKAAAQKEPRGLYLLGMLHLDNDPSQGARLLLQAAQAKDRDAQYRLGLLYGAGRGVEKDEQLGMQWVRKAAGQGQAQAQYFMAAAYSRGLYGLKRDDIAAADWLRRSARQGNVEAQYALANAYAEGRGVRYDPNEALGWIQLAAKNNHPQAAEAAARIKELIERKKKR
jgi:TPR repeat protein